MPKPPPGTPVDWSNPLTSGLVGYWLANEGSGSTLGDLTGLAMPLTIGGGATWDTSDVGPVLRCDTTGAGAEATLPSSLRMAWPLTLACRMRILGAPAASASFFGAAHNNNDSNPWACWQLYQAGYDMGLSVNTGGVFNSLGSGVPINTLYGIDVTFVAVITSTSRVIYRDGIAVKSSDTSLGNPTYGPSALLACGNYTGISRNSNMLFQAGAVWGRALAEGEVTDLSTAWSSTGGWLTTSGGGGVSAAARYFFMRRMMEG